MLLVAMQETASGDSVLLGSLDLSYHELNTTHSYHELNTTHSRTLNQGLYVSSMAVHPWCRKQGVGGKLLKEAEALAMERGVSVGSWGRCYFGLAVMLKLSEASGAAQLELVYSC